MSFVLENIHAELHLLNEVIVVKVAISIFAGFEGYMQSPDESKGEQM
jgi:hypothetical protein